MEKVNRIRISIREKFPETNSSSSHSVSISLSGKYYKPEEMNLKIDKDGVIFIPNAVDDFGWEFEKYNDVLTKIQYISSMYEIKSNPKKLRILKEVIKSFTGAKKVVFEFENQFKDAYNKAVKENDDELPCISDFGSSIDHNSSDIFPEILESRNTIKDFIFNPNSWLFLGNDNSIDDPDSFYVTDEEKKKKEKEEPVAIASIDFGGKIGRIDFELKDFPTKFGVVREIYDSGYDMLSTFCIDPKTDEIKDSHNIPKKNNEKYLRLFKFFKYYPLNSTYENKIYVAYVSDDFENTFLNNIKEKGGHLCMNDAWKKTREDLKDNNDECRFFEVHIKTKEFGEIL